MRFKLVVDAHAVLMPSNAPGQSLLIRRRSHIDVRVIQIGVPTEDAPDFGIDRRAVDELNEGGVLRHDVGDREQFAARRVRAFASINAIILLTRKSATSVADYVQRLSQRMAALNRAQNVLFAADVVSCSLAALVDDLKSVYPQISWSGDDAELPGNAVVALSLIFNELSTNALKYGALATQGGTVAITSTISSGADGASAVEVVWKEAGGSTVVVQPTRTGFGTQLIELSIQETLKGTIAREWDPGGLTCVLRFSCAELAGGAA